MAQLAVLKQGGQRLGVMVPLKQIEYGIGYIIIRSHYTPDSIYLRGPFHYPYI